MDAPKRLQREGGQPSVMYLAELTGRGVTIAVIDSGADTSAPDLAAKSPRTFNLVSGTSGVRDAVGHGTFVASLAATADRVLELTGDGVVRRKPDATYV